MNKKQKKWGVRMVSFALAGLCLCVGALAAGDKDDPLVTLSYLTKTAIPDILEQVEEQAEEHQTDLLEQFNAAIDDYKKQAQKTETAAPVSVNYQVVELAQGQTMTLGVGAEVLLRAGGAAVTFADTQTLVDVTAGGTLASGGVLEANHLYMTTAEGGVIAPQGETAKLMVCGTYTVA